jgi:hypothetical protein
MLSTRRTSEFNVGLSSQKNNKENILILRRGSTIVEDRWIHFSDREIDLNLEVSKFLGSRLNFFRKIGDIKYVLLALSKEGVLTLIPSIGEDINEDAEIRVFENLSRVVPLVLLRLTQDGSGNLSSFKSLSESDLELYTGFGNFTTKGENGPLGVSGPTGHNGVVGLTGLQGEPGFIGIRGPLGVGGERGVDIRGITGIRGNPGTC